MVGLRHELLFFGVDPGKSGAIAALDASGNCVGSVRLCETPHDIWSWLRDKSSHCDKSFAVLERVSARPGQGVSSTFKFGTSYGMAKGLLVAAGIPHEEKTPSVWMRHMGLTSPKGTSKTDHKRKLKQRAQELWPDVKVTNKEADALLIAEFARRVRSTNPGGT